MSQSGAAATKAEATAYDLEKVSFSYGSDVVLRDIDLEVREGEFLCLLGRSGCGKSTLLRLLAGLETPVGGTVRWMGERVTGPGVGFGVVFQDYSLYPWMTLEKNVALALDHSAPALRKFERLQLAREYLALVGLEGCASKHPFELSGGMRQRGAIARALALGSPALLLDEPFGALDPLNRARLQDLLLETCARPEARKTIVFVTHDLEEAVFLGDRVVLLGSNPGRITGEFSVDFPRPRRRREVFGSKRFNDIVGEISERYRLDMLDKTEEGSTVWGPAEGI